MPTLPTSKTSTRSGGHRLRRGFTLLEILLVVAISLIVSALAVPAFTRSFRAANLRTAARAVVSASRYARNMAVLKQRQMTVFFNSHDGTIEITALERTSGRHLDAFLDARRGLVTAEEDAYAVQVERRHQLPELVRIVDFSAPGSAQEMDGIFWVNYFPSGVSDSFSIRIADPLRHRSVRVEVDHLAGTVTTTYE